MDPTHNLEFRSTQARHLCTCLPLLRSHPPLLSPPQPGWSQLPRRQSFPAFPWRDPEWRLKEGSVPAPMRMLLTILAAGSLVGECPLPRGPLTQEPVTRVSPCTPPSPGRPVSVSSLLRLNWMLSFPGEVLVAQVTRKDERPQTLGSSRDTTEPQDSGVLPAV